MKKEIANGKLRICEDKDLLKYANKIPVSKFAEEISQRDYLEDATIKVNGKRLSVYDDDAYNFVKGKENSNENTLDEERSR